MSDAPTFGFQLTENRAFVRIVLPSTEVVLSVLELEAILSDLAQLRAQMQPPVPLECPPHVSGVRSVFEAAIVSAPTQEAPTGTGGAISFRSPAFGWLRIHLSVDGIEQLRRDLASPLTLQKVPQAN